MLTWFLSRFQAKFVLFERNNTVEGRGHKVKEVFLESGILNSESNVSLLATSTKVSERVPKVKKKGFTFFITFSQ